MRTTLLGTKIIKEAENLLSARYIEEGDPRKNNTKNKGVFLDNLIQEFDTLQHQNNKKFQGKGKEQLPYCAMTASVALDRALKQYNGKKNTMRSAGATELIEIARTHNIRVDNKPSVGAMFLTLQGGNPNKRHAGIVWKVGDNGKHIQTIEGNAWSGSAMQIGNSGCAVDANNKEGIISRKISVSKVKEFLHIEELEGTKINDYPDTPAMLADEDDVCLLDSELALDADGGSSGDTDKTENYNADDYICGIPKEYIHIGGSVIMLGLFCVLTKKLRE